MSCLLGRLRAKSPSSGGQRAPRSRSRQAPALRPVSVHFAAAQERGSAHCTARIPGLRRARREAGTQGVKCGRPGRAAGRRRARELGLQTAPAGPGVRAPAQPQPHPPASASLSPSPGSALHALRSELQVSCSALRPTGHGELGASPGKQRPRVPSEPQAAER